MISPPQWPRGSALNWAATVMADPATRPMADASQGPAGPDKKWTSMSSSKFGRVSIAGRPMLQSFSDASEAAPACDLLVKGQEVVDRQRLVPHPRSQRLLQGNVGLG